MIHERITVEMKRWIQEQAPGTRDSRGCAKKAHFPNFKDKGIESAAYICMIDMIEPLNS